MAYIYIALTLIFTVYGQLVIKWQISKAGQFPAGVLDKVFFLLRQFGNLWILSGFAAAFLAALCWMAAMTRFDLSRAYPFMSLAFVLVMAFSILFLNEHLTWSKAIGTALVVAGLIVLSR